MSYSLAKVIHIAAVLYAFAALGALIIRQVDGTTGERGRKLAGLTHGIALLAVLITGFMLLAGLGEGVGVPLWIWLKLVIWLLVGASLVAVRRLPNLASLLWLVLPLLGAAAAYLAIYRPVG